MREREKSNPSDEEPEVTPEMIEAGAEIVSTYSPEETTAHAVADETYRAMEAVRLKKPRRPRGA